jgi:hypothetical protein
MSKHRKHSFSNDVLSFLDKATAAHSVFSFPDICCEMFADLSNKHHRIRLSGLAVLPTSCLYCMESL